LISPKVNAIAVLGAVLTTIAAFILARWAIRIKRSHIHNWSAGVILGNGKGLFGIRHQAAQVLLEAKVDAIVGLGLLVIGGLCQVVSILLVWEIATVYSGLMVLVAVLAAVCAFRPLQKRIFLAVFRSMLDEYIVARSHELDAREESPKQEEMDPLLHELKFYLKDRIPPPDIEALFNRTAKRLVERSPSR
jgi:hypothetical protein